MKPLDFFEKHAAVWLSLYSCGSVLTISVVAGNFGGAAAGTVAGFLVLGGTMGYEALSRMQAEKRLSGKISGLGVNQDRLTRELARTRGEVDGIKDDMLRTSVLLKKQAAAPSATDIKPVPAPINEPISNRIQKSFEKMGSKPRASVTDTAKRYEELLVPAATRSASIFAEEPDEDMGRTLSARPADYSDTVVSELLHHAVHNDRIEVFAQPIMRLPSRRLNYLELFARIRARAGVYLAADRYRHIAERETLIADIDHLLLLHILDTIRADARRGLDLAYFMNISSHSLTDAAFMGDLLEFIRRNRDLMQSLVLELQQNDFNALSDNQLAILKGLSMAGCRFSIDNISNPNMDVVKLQKLNVEFIKIDAGRLTSLAGTSEGETIIQRLKTRLDSANITLIVEKMESERDVRELLDFEIDFGEGYLFGKPDLEIAYRPKKAA